MEMEKEAVARQLKTHKSMFEASRDKKRARRYHSRNFTLGYVQADGRYLSRAGLRGRKRWLLLALVLSVYCVVIGQLLASGSEYVQFSGDDSTILPQGGAIDSVRVAGPILGYRGEPLNLSTQGGSILLEAGNQRNVPTGNRVLNSSQAYFETDSVRLVPFFNLSVCTADRRPLLSVNSSLVYLRTSAAMFKNITATEAVTKTVVSSADLSLSGPLVSLSSVLGVAAQGQQVTVSSGTIRVSGQAAINLEGKKGLSTRSLPTSTTTGGPGLRSGYRLCACSSGLLFLVPATSIGCRANEIINPCSSTL